MAGEITFDDVVAMAQRRLPGLANQFGLRINEQGLRVGKTAHRFDCIKGSDRGYFLVSQEPDGRVLVQLFMNDLVQGEPVVLIPNAHFN